MSLSLAVEFQNDLDVVISEDEHVAVVVKHEGGSPDCAQRGGTDVLAAPSGLWHGRAGRAN